MHPTKNDLADNTRKAAIDLLQARLSDAIDLTLQTKQAHWNVKGPNFIALHELFDRLHAEMDGHVDTIAERLVSLGGQAYGTVGHVAKTSGLAAYPLDISASGEHIEALSDALAKFGALARQSIDDADTIGDKDTADVFTGISNAVDKSLWFVEAHRA